MAGEISINCGAMRAASIPYQDAAWSQAGVDAMWQAIGYPPPAPRVPQTLIGWYSIPTKSGTMLALSKSGKMRKDSFRHRTKEENEFLNFWGKAVTDPCRRQSGISKIAGGILQIASVFVPAAGAAMFAAAEVGNAALDASKIGRDMKQAETLLTQAALATAQPTAIVPVMPQPAPLVAPTSTLVPQPVARSAPPARARARWQPRDYAVAAGLSVFAYLLIRRLQR